MDKTELESKCNRKIWWTGTKRGEIFNLVTEGKSVQEICKAINSKRFAVQGIIAHPYFLTRLEAFLKEILFHHQTNRILALHEVFQLYWDVIVGKKIVDGLTVDQASKHFTKLLDLKEKEPKVINPQQFNIILGILKTAPKNASNLPKDFGFEGLQIPEHEKPKSNPQLDKGEKDQDEQRPGD